MIDLLTTDRNYLRLDEIMALFEVSRRTVYYWVSRRRIPYVHVGRTLRFPVADLRRLTVRQQRLRRPVKVLCTDAQPPTRSASSLPVSS
jgi:excisionase family DNA binding protein